MAWQREERERRSYCKSGVPHFISHFRVSPTSRCPPLYLSLQGVPHFKVSPTSSPTSECPHFRVSPTSRCPPFQGIPHFKVSPTSRCPPLQGVKVSPTSRCQGVPHFNFRVSPTSGTSRCLPFWPHYTTCIPIGLSPSHSCKLEVHSGVFS